MNTTLLILETVRIINIIGEQDLNTVRFFDTAVIRCLRHTAGKRQDPECTKAKKPRLNLKGENWTFLKDTANGHLKRGGGHQGHADQNLRNSLIPEEPPLSGMGDRDGG